jgi:phospholipid/cholesterol/gamma-HCH transport system substrate-binding protein
MSQALKVGLFATIALVLLGYFVMRIEDLNPFSEPAYELEAEFESVAGLDDKATVRVAGVRVGRVDGIRLEDGKAVLRLVLETPVELRQGASASIANLGMLGDKYVQLDPGPRGAPPLPDGALLPGSAPLSFDEALSKVSSLGDSLQDALGGLSGESGEETPVSRLLDNLDATTREIRALVADNRAQIASSIDNFESLSGSMADSLPRLADQMERLLTQIEAVVTENRSNLRDGMENAREVTAELKESMENLTAISDKIARGEGTIGKLVNSDETHDQLVSTLDSIETGVASLSDTLGRVGKLQLDLAYDGYWLEDLEESHSALSFTLDPQSDRFYYLQVVDDPRGRADVETRETTVTNPDGSTETTTIRTVKTDDDVLFSAQFGFELGAATRFRAGILESTAGLGVDYPLFDRKLWLTLDAFNFDREDDLAPQLRFATRFRLNEHLYLLGGLDDFLESDRDSIFLGAGIRWSDDDLKYLIGSVPTF